MKLIVGLGNLGRRYEQTRHNIGFLVVDELAHSLEASEWHVSDKLKSALSEAHLGDEPVILAKPQTMMNGSGEAVQRLVQEYRLKPEDVTVIHDDIDLEEGEVRTKLGGSAGGQKGVESIAAHIGTDFHHIRVGIGRNQRPQVPSEIYVLQLLPESLIEQLPTIETDIRAQITAQ